MRTFLFALPLLLLACSSSPPPTGAGGGTSSACGPNVDLTMSPNCGACGVVCSDMGSTCAMFGGAYKCTNPAAGCPAVCAIVGEVCEVVDGGYTCVTPDAGADGP